MRRPLTAALGSAVALIAGLLAGPAPTAEAAVTNQVAILASTVTGGLDSIEAQEVVAQGLSPALIDDATWQGMSTADFATYRALILGDPTCGATAPSAAEFDPTAWGEAVTGNVLINGTDPVFHAGQGGEALVRRSVDFAVANPAKTGLYVSLSCYYHDTTARTPVKLLDAIRPGGFTVTGVGCYNDAHIVATHPSLDGLTDATLSNWSCSVHEAFDTWPADFTVLALAKDFGSAFTASDGTVGTPYILASGLGLRSFPLSVDPTSATASVGSTYTVTATLLDADTREPAPGVLLQAFATDAGTGLSVSTALACSTLLCRTDTAGQVRFSYSSTNPGEDVITVWNDKNADDRVDVGEAQVRASVTWVRSESTTWLALGDSYSAGVGIPGDPDNLTYPQCRTHSAKSYAGRARDLAVAAGHTIAFKFAACLGAVTADIRSRPQPGTDQLKQLDYVTANKPDVVTLTVGGNDIGFAGVAKNCVLNSVVPYLVACPVDSNAMTLVGQTRGERSWWDGLFDRLVATYVAVRKAQPASGQLYVLTYPVAFANPLQWRLPNLVGNNCFGFSTEEAKLANALSVRLGDTIYKAVQAANGRVGGVHFVDWRPPVTTERLRGRTQRVAYDPAGLCSRATAASDWSMNGLYLPGLPHPGLALADSFHPTAVGYRAGAGQLFDGLRQYTW